MSKDHKTSIGTHEFVAPMGGSAQGELGLILHSFRLEGETIIRLSTGQEVKGTPHPRPGGYLVAHAGSHSDGSRRQLRLHRIKFALAHGWLPEFIDHIDGDKQNNAIDNLRPCTRFQNAANSSYRGLPPSSTGHRNVKNTRSGRYGAQVCQDGEYIWLGTFDTPEEAKAVVEAFKQQQRGDFYVRYMKREKGRRVLRIRTTKSD